MSNQIKKRPIISRDWDGQWQFKRTTNTENLVLIDDPFRWHERFAGQLIAFVSNMLRNVFKNL